MITLTGFADQSKNVQATVTPTPGGVGCSTDTLLDVSLTGNLLTPPPDISLALKSGTIVCIGTGGTVVGEVIGGVLVLPGEPAFVGVTITTVSITGTCPTDSVLATVASISATPDGLTIGPVCVRYH